MVVLMARGKTYLWMLLGLMKLNLFLYHVWRWRTTSEGLSPSAKVAVELALVSLMQNWILSEQ